MKAMVAYLSISKNGTPLYTNLPVSGNVIIGKEAVLDPTRQFPSTVKDIRRLVRLPHNYLSTNHALLCSSPNGRARLYDLESTNGIHTATKTPIDGSLDLSPGGAEFIIGPYHCRYTTKEEPKGYRRKQALIVVDGEKNKGRAPKGYVNDLIDFLKKSRHFKEVTVLGYRKATHQNVTRALKRAIEKSAEGGIFVLYYIGRFNTDHSLMLTGNPKSARPYCQDELRVDMRNIAGNKLVILDTPPVDGWETRYARNREDDLFPENTVIAASMTDMRSMEKNSTSMANIKNLRRALRQDNLVNILGFDNHIVPPDSGAIIAVPNLEAAIRQSS